MIGRLRGKVLTCTPTQILLDVTGVGYDVHIPLSTYYCLASDPGSEVSLQIHTHVREDTLQLFGFASEAERSAFEILIGISGVGPRLALSILSGIGVAELRAAVTRQDRARLQKIPGVGKKTAERLLLELRDKLGQSGDAESGLAPGGDVKSASSQLQEDAVSALVNLGYPSELSKKAVDRALADAGEAPTLETILRGALAGLVR